MSDIIAQLGWDFCKSECKHLAVYIRAVFPTGTNLNACWLSQGTFAPIVGNGHHFELGVGINGHATFWECDESDFSAYLDGYVTHMFGASTFRSFDMPGLPMSRYALLKGITGTVDAGDLAYSGTLSALGDVNTACINTSCAARSEIILDFIYSACNWKFGLGYAFSGQSAESSNCCSVGSSDSSSSLYGFKGGTGLVEIKYKLVDKTVFSGVLATPVTPALATFDAEKDESVATKDSGAYSYGMDTDGADMATDSFTLPNLSCNTSGLMGSQILNKVFAHIDYVWTDSCWQPELGILGSVGFGSGSKTTAQYWDLGVRLGFAF